MRKAPCVETVGSKNLKKKNCKNKIEKMVDYFFLLCIKVLSNLG